MTLTRLIKRWPGQVYCAFFASYAAEVIVLIHESIPFQLKNKYIYASGRYIILNGNIVSTQISFINICS